MDEKLIRIKGLEKEINHLMEFWNEEDDRIIGEKTMELCQLQQEILDEIKNTTLH